MRTFNGRLQRISLLCRGGPVKAHFAFDSCNAIYCRNSDMRAFAVLTANTQKADLSGLPVSRHNGKLVNVRLLLQWIATCPNCKECLVMRWQ
jgi:hypothetical protein